MTPRPVPDPASSTRGQSVRTALGSRGTGGPDRSSPAGGLTSVLDRYGSRGDSPSGGASVGRRPGNVRYASGPSRRVAPAGGTRTGAGATTSRGPASGGAIAGGPTSGRGAVGSRYAARGSVRPSTPTGTYGTGVGTSYGSSIRPAAPRPVTSYVDPNPTRSSWTWYPWGCTNPSIGFSVNFGYYGCNTYGWWYWPCYLGWYTPYRYRYFYHPRYYGPAWGTSFVYVYDSSPDVVYVESDPEVVYVEREPEVVYEDAGNAQAFGPRAAADALALEEGAVPEGAGGTLSLASERYLSLGDRAFRDGRYGDAVHFYARAVEFTPDVGVLYLILADALFATGDYHYAAYAVRRALDLEPALVDSVVDKHSFYGDPADFDRQLAVLETYVRDHPLDPDATLVLALNYLFGARPAAAVDLLLSRSTESGELRGPESLVLSAAQRIQYGAASSGER